LKREQGAGLVVIGVETGSPAEAGGMMVGDILVGIEGHPILDHDELFARLSGDAVGKSIAVEILRGGKPETLKVKVGARA
jgi:S1-C subfamily serine protease